MRETIFSRNFIFADRRKKTANLRTLQKFLTTWYQHQNVYQLGEIILATFLWLRNKLCQLFFYKTKETKWNFETKRYIFFLSDISSYPKRTEMEDHCCIQWRIQTLSWGGDPVLFYSPSRRLFFLQSFLLFHPN